MGELGRILVEDTRKRLVEAYPADVRGALETFWSVHTGQVLFAARALHETALDDVWTRTMR